MLTEQDAREVEDHASEGEKEETLSLYPSALGLQHPRTRPVETPQDNFE